MSKETLHSHLRECEVLKLYEGLVKCGNCIRVVYHKHTVKNHVVYCENEVMIERENLCHTKRISITGLAAGSGAPKGYVPLFDAGFFLKTVNINAQGSGRS